MSGRVRAAAVRMANPAFILRNHSVEAALNAAVSRQDFQPFEELLNVLSRPFKDRPELERSPRRPVPRNPFVRPSAAPKRHHSIVGLNASPIGLTTRFMLHCSFVYSTCARCRIGISRSASFHNM